MKTLLPAACIVLLFVMVGAASLGWRAAFPKFFSDSPMLLLLLPAGTAYDISEAEAETLIARRLVFHDETIANDNAAYFRPCEGVPPEKVFEIILALRRH